MNIKELMIQHVVKKKALTVLAIVIISLISLGGIYYYSNLKEKAREESHYEIEAISKLKVGQIEQWYNERIGDVNMLTQSIIFVHVVEKWLTEKGDTQSESDIRNRLQVIKTTKGYDDIIIFSKQGDILLSLDDTHQSTTIFQKSLIDESISKKVVIVSELYFNKLQNETHFDLYSPIINNNNEIIAIIAFHVNPDKYLFPLVQQWPTKRKSAETLLIRQKADSVQFLNSLRHLNNKSLELIIPLSEIGIPAVQAVLGKRGLFEGKDYRGIDVLSSISEIKNTNWLMVAKIDKSEIFTELYYSAASLVIFLLFLIFFTSVGLAWIYSLDKERVYRQLFLREKEYSKSLLQFKTILYSIGDAVITTDKSGIVQQLNPVAEQMTGWSESEARGKEFNKVIQLFNEISGETIENLVHRVLQKESIIEFTNHTILKTKENIEIPIASGGAPIKDERNQVVGVVLVFRDQTFKYKTEKALRESEERYKAIYENAAIGIYQIDNDGNLILANSAFIKMLGVDKFDDISGKQLVKKGFATVESRSEYKMILNKEGIINDYQDKWKRVDGKEIYVLESARAIYDENNNLEFYEGIVLDITDVKLAAQELTIARDRAIAMEKLKTEFLAQMSHEIRTPLNAMLSTIDFVREEVSDKLSYDANSIFNIIDTSGKRIVNTIQSILNMSELQSGSYELIKSKFHLCDEVIIPVIDLYAQILVDKRIKLKFDKEAEDFVLLSDFYSFEQIFKNIFDNAVKFTKQGSIAIKLSKSDSNLNLEIIDTGIGISDEYLQKIFEPFTQESQGYSRPYDGCGLGLAITRKYCELDNIGLEINSERGKGTHVKLTIRNSTLA